MVNGNNGRERLQANAAHNQAGGSRQAPPKPDETNPDLKIAVDPDVVRRFNDCRLDVGWAFDTPPKPRDCVLPGFLAGTVGSVVAPGGAGKSMACMQLALSVAAGRDIWGLFGIPMAEMPSGVVLYVNGEDPPNEVHHRLHAMGHEAQRLAGPRRWPELRDRMAANVDMFSIVGAGIRLAELGTEARLALVVDGPLFPILIQRGFGARLTILDTTSRMVPTLNMADASHAGAYLEYLERYCRAANSATLFVHHMNKGAILNSLGGMQQSVSGSHKLTDNARWQMNLWTMEEKEAADRGIPADEARRWVQVQIPKLNYGPNQGRLFWRRGEGGVLEGADPGPSRAEARHQAAGQQGHEVQPHGRQEFKG